MNNKSNQEQGEIALFRDEFTDIAPIKQDKIPPQRYSGKHKSATDKKNQQDLTELTQAAASFQFSDGFEGHFESKYGQKYIKPGTDSHEIKRLRRGDYPPDLILDLHGYKREEAKLEIAALIQAAQKHHVQCVCIVHGIGTRILKKSIPNWLVQHPLVAGFHQAPLEWGGKGALLVLIELPQINNKY